jgi:hypothetical protein
VTDERGILGNLPRSRPGRRSERREGADRETTAGPESSGSKPHGDPLGEATHRGRPASPAKTRPQRPGSSQRPAPTPTAASGGRAPGSGRGGEPRLATAQRHEPPLPEPEGDRSPAGAGADVVLGAARVAEGITVAGIRVATRVAGGVLRRIPRP